MNKENREKFSQHDIPWQYLTTSTVQFEDRSLMEVAAIEPGQVEKDFLRRHETEAMRYWEFRAQLMHMTVSAEQWRKIPLHLAQQRNLYLLRLFNDHSYQGVKNQLRLLPTDKEPMGGITSPGKSAVIDFTPFTPPSVKNEVDQAQRIVHAVMHRSLRENDYIFQASVVELGRAGFDVIWSPIKKNPLHVHIIHRESPAHYPVWADALTRVWRRVIL